MQRYFFPRTFKHDGGSKQFVQRSNCKPKSGVPKNINVNKSEGWKDVCFQLSRNLECYKKSDLNKFEHELVRMTHLEGGRGSGWF